MVLIIAGITYRHEQNHLTVVWGLGENKYLQIPFWGGKVPPCFLWRKLAVCQSLWKMVAAALDTFDTNPLGTLNLTRDLRHHNLVWFAWKNTWNYKRYLTWYFSYFLEVFLPMPNHKGDILQSIAVNTAQRQPLFAILLGVAAQSEIQFSSVPDRHPPGNFWKVSKSGQIPWK